MTMSPHAPDGQAARVLEALHQAYPHPISWAVIAKEARTKNVGGRIGELKAAGWQIEGAGDHPLADDGTQLYRLTSPHQAAQNEKHLGITATWTSDGGLRVRVHRGLSGRLTPHQCDDLRRQVEAILRPVVASHQVSEGVGADEEIDLDSLFDLPTAWSEFADQAMERR